jgi:hypothetical protein
MSDLKKLNQQDPRSWTENLHRAKKLKRAVEASSWIKQLNRALNREVEDQKVEPEQSKKKLNPSSWTDGAFDPRMCHQSRRKSERSLSWARRSTPFRSPKGVTDCTLTLSSMYKGDKSFKSMSIAHTFVNRESTTYQHFNWNTAQKIKNTFSRTEKFDTFLVHLI